MISILSSIFLFSLSNMSKFIYILKESGERPEGGTYAQQSLQTRSSPGIYLL